ncbi:MAG: cobalamin-dependent protein, partial [Candidatus Thorarchaeota archaeon]
MKVLMINICLRPEHPRLLFPIGLGYVASAVKKAGFDLEILDVDAYRYTDEEVEQFIKEKDYDVVAFGCIVTGYKIVKKLAETIKKHKRVPIVCGNSVASSIPELLLSGTKVDIAVIGEI